MMDVKHQCSVCKVCSAVFAHQVCKELVCWVYVICWKKSNIAHEEYKSFGVKQPGSYMDHDKDKHTGKPVLACIPPGQWSSGPWSPFWWRRVTLDSEWPRGTYHTSLSRRSPDKSSPDSLPAASCSHVFPSLHLLSTFSPHLLPKFSFLPSFHLAHSTSLSGLPGSSPASPCSRQCGQGDIYLQHYPFPADVLTWTTLTCRGVKAPTWVTGPFIFWTEFAFPISTVNSDCLPLSSPYTRLAISPASLDFQLLWPLPSPVCSMYMRVSQPLTSHQVMTLHSLQPHQTLVLENGGCVLLMT